MVCYSCLPSVFVISLYVVSHIHLLSFHEGEKDLREKDDKEGSSEEKKPYPSNTMANDLSVLLSSGFLSRKHSCHFKSRTTLKE